MPSLERVGAIAYEASSIVGAISRLAGSDIGGAAARVARRLPPDISITEQELRSHLLKIARTCVSGVHDDAANGATMTLRRRLVDLIREEVVRGWMTGEPPSRETMLQALDRLERAQKACMPSVDQSFVAELSERGGLDLVVEVAHDMRSPLTSILFLSEVLHSGQSGALNDVQKRQIGIVYSAALGLVGMASDMIEMAKGGSRLPDRQPVAFSVNELLQNVHDLVRPTSEEKQVVLDVRTLQSPHRVGHPIPLSRVLLNLTTNALKFAHDGDVEVSARSRGGGRVEFAVRDTGPGISEAAMKTLFQPFRREPARESGYYFSGTGLGLAISRRLIAAMGSELKVETRPEWGTRFSFELHLPPASPL
ncbi:MAG: HAMP domain-containing sensor histidine kinase [Gemmatimonadota bacterium]